MLKLKLQYFGHLMQRTDSVEKTLMLGKIEGRRIRGQQRMRWLDSTTDSMDMSLSNDAPIYRVAPHPGGPLYVSDAPNNREGPQEKKSSKCLNKQS